MVKDIKKRLKNDYTMFRCHVAFGHPMWLNIAETGAQLWDTADLLEERASTLGEASVEKAVNDFSKILDDFERLLRHNATLN